MSTLFLFPLFAYLLAGLSHVVARAFGGQGSWFGARMALFWSLLAVSPLMLFQGLVAGFVGTGAAQLAVGLAVGGVFLFLWLSALTEAERARPVQGS